MNNKATTLANKGRLINLLDLSGVTHIDHNHHSTSTALDYPQAVLSC